MEYSSGTKMLKTFETLGINLGTIGPNVIEAWYDTENLKLKQFLNWISTALSEENVIHPEQIDEYEKYCSQGLIPSDEQYETSIVEISRKYPGIYEIDDNNFEIEIMKDELEILLEDNEKMDGILQLHGVLSKKEKIATIELEEQKVATKIELERAEENCYQFSSKLDEINGKLHTQIESCSNKLLEYEFSSTYILPINKYSPCYQDVMSYFGLLDEKEFIKLPQIQSAVLTCSKLTQSVLRNKNSDNLEKLKNRLLRSIQHKNYKEAVKKKLERELKFLERFNVYENEHSLGFKQQVETNMEIKSNHFAISTSEFEKLLLQISEKYIDIPTIHKARKEVQLLENKISMVNDVEDIFTTIFSYHTLFYILLMVNYEDISIADPFFRAVHNYVANDLNKCESRMEAMENITRERKLLEAKPLLEKNPLIQAVLKLLSSSSSDDAEINNTLTLINNMNKVDDHFESIDQLLQFRKQIRPIEKNNKMLLSHLKNGPTVEFVTYPYKLYEAFTAMEKSLDMQNKLVTTSTEIWKDAIKQRTSDEWLKFKRQLWMYFLTQPHKVVSYIQKIKAESEKISIENM